MSDALMQYLDEDRPIWSKYQVHKNLQLLRWLIMSMTHCTSFLHIFWVMIMQKWLSLRSSDRAWSMYVRHNCELTVVRHYCSLHCCACASLLLPEEERVVWLGLEPQSHPGPWSFACVALLDLWLKLVKFLILLLWDLVVMARGPLHVLHCWICDSN